MQWKATSELTLMVNPRIRTQWKRWQIFLGEFKQISLGWQHYLKKLLKLQAIDIRVATPSPKKQFVVGFRLFKMKFSFFSLYISSHGFQKVKI
jgi:hypothetical protein